MIKEEDSQNRVVWMGAIQHSGACVVWVMAIFGAPCNSLVGVGLVSSPLTCLAVCGRRSFPSYSALESSRTITAVTVDVRVTK